MSDEHDDCVRLNRDCDNCRAQGKFPILSGLTDQQLDAVERKAREVIAADKASDISPFDAQYLAMRAQDMAWEIRELRRKAGVR